MTTETITTATTLPAGTWHKANPPFTAAQLQDQDRSPSWADEFTAMTGVASDLTFGAFTDDVIDGKIQSLFGVIIPATNKTLIALRNQVYNVLSVLRPEWYDHNNGELLNALPDGVDGRSKLVLKAEEEAKLAADRKKKAAEAAQKRRDEERAEIKSGVESAFGKIGDHAELAKLVAVIAGQPFEAAKALLVDQLAPTLAALGLGDVPYAEQVVFAKLPEAWFRELADGTLKIRDALPKAKPTGPNRHQKALLRSIFQFIEKHGRGCLIDTMHMLSPSLSFAGVDFVSKDILLPEIIVTDDEPEVLAASDV